MNHLITDRLTLGELLREKENDRVTPLMLAACNPSAGVIEILQTAIGDNKEQAEIIKQKDDDGLTIVHQAARKGTVEVFTYTQYILISAIPASPYSRAILTGDHLR